MKLVVTVDTEGDNQWDHGRPLSTENIGYCEPFQVLCERYALPTTYLITSEIAADPKAVSFLQPLVEKGKAEVGAHLHPWTTPPFLDQPGLRFNDPNHTFPSELEPPLLEAKLATLTGQIQEALGRRPTSFRAGRFGFNAACASALSRLGYLVDTSVTPHVSWQRVPGLPYGGGGPDFRDQPVNPFRIITDDGQRLLELPVTVFVTTALVRRFPGLLPELAGSFRGWRPRRWRWLFPRRIWLYPDITMTWRHLALAWHTAQRLGLPVAVLMLHSSELMPGASPNHPTKEAVQDLLTMLERFFSCVNEEGGEGATLTEAAKLILQSPGLEQRAL